jgi:hypothetical protein
MVSANALMIENKIPKKNSLAAESVLDKSFGQVRH